MQGDVRDRLNNQSLASDFGGNGQNNNGSMRILNFSIPVNSWLKVLPIYQGRRFVSIQNIGGNAGACRVQLAYDNQNSNSLFDIEEFTPRFIPTNAVYLYVSDPLATGSTVVNVQVMES